ncbi:MAG: hypothetical protein FH762_00260 [Firmicutes bacterium]|nr:hypothetical protein [Bacillota bacterium]
MRLSSFKTDVFAGISKRQVEFDKGLNVIIGPNEAGKSTLIEAIYATIFQEARLRMNLGVDKDFKARFMPYPAGEHINGILEFIIDGEKYKLKKEWGKEHSTVLELPDGQILKNSGSIKRKLKDLFVFGRASYGNIVFARQRDVKQAVERIIGNDDIVHTVSSFLRKAVMELDGISVEHLRSRLGEEIDNLVKRWDLNNDRPDNPNRDINNPYKVGYGKIYEAYINKVSIERKMKKALEMEEQLAGLSRELQALEEEQQGLKTEIDQMAEIENDVVKRASLEPEIKRLKEKTGTLKRINREWPVRADELVRKKEELNNLDKSLKGLSREKSRAREKARLNESRSILEKINRLKKEMQEKYEERQEIKQITIEDIKEMESYQDIIKRNKAAMEAGTLLGVINRACDKVILTRGLAEQEEIEAGVEFKADGYLHLVIEGIVDVEIKSGEIDFDSLRREYQLAQSKLDKLLNNFGVESINEARRKREDYNRLTSELNNLNQQIKGLLDGRKYEDLQEEAGKLNEMESVRDEGTVEKELDRANKVRSKLLAEIKSLEDRINSWQEEYGDVDKLFELMVSIGTELKAIKEQLIGLAELPDQYDTAEGFNSSLTRLRKKKEELDDRFTSKREELRDIMAAMPEESYEELLVSRQDYQKRFDRLQKKARDLIKIRAVLHRKLAEMDNNSFDPLVDLFSRYLSILTAGNYQIGDVNNNFQLKIVNEKNSSLPVDINLLSFGTYDGVALAFRLALLEQLFKDREGFIILDDCLVNLDPARKKEAVILINEFAEKYQVIFTTCNPDTADSLGGRVIEFTA